MAGVIVSIVFGSLGIVFTLLRLSWKFSENMASLTTKVDSLTKAVDRLDGHVANLADREDEQDRRIAVLEMRVGAS